MPAARDAGMHEGRAGAGRPRPGQRLWQGFCRLVTAVYYARCEVAGLEHLPARGPVLLCANHPNALADAVVLQAALPRLLHPVARSGLFRNPLLRPFLKLQQAVPVRRRRDPADDPRRNEDAFQMVYELFAAGGAVLIFPEGQSHDDPRLRPLKTGAARMALGARTRGPAPVLLPVGLNFAHRGRFRSRVFVQVGPPVPVPAADEHDEAAVRALTAALARGLEAVTVNVASYDELELLRALERFFALRHGRYRARGMAARQRALQRLAEGHARLRALVDDRRLAALRRRLLQFERLCRHLGVRDHQLTVRYRPAVVARFAARCLAVTLLIFPVAAWGWVTSGLPSWFTRRLSARLARGPDQFDTAAMAAGLVLFALFWSAETALAWTLAGPGPALALAASLPPGAAAATFFRRERERITDSLRAFLLFARRRHLKAELLARRRALERELARLVRLLRRHELEATRDHGLQLGAGLTAEPRWKNGADTGGAG